MGDYGDFWTTPAPTTAPPPPPPPRTDDYAWAATVPPAYPPPVDAPPPPPANWPAAPPPAWPPPANAAPPGWEAPGAPQWSPETAFPQQRSRMSLATILRVVVLLAVIGGGAGWQLLKDTVDPLVVPVTLAGLSQVQTAEIASETQKMRDGLAGDNIGSPVAAFYGEGEVPLVMLMAGRASDESAADAWGEMAKESDDDMQVSEGRLITTVNGEFMCGTVRVEGNAGGAICVWGGAESDGVVWHFRSPDMTAVADIAAAARDQLNA